MHKFRSKEDLAAAIIAQRGEIESSIEAGESNSLMQATGMTDHASFAKYKEACAAGRLDTPSKHDFVGFTCVAHSQAELGDHVVASVPNELSPDENLAVTAADLSEAYTKHNPDDQELHTCPMLVPLGQNADEVLADIDKDLQLQSGASHAQVLDAMSRATDSMDQVEKEIDDLIQQTEDAHVAEEAEEPEPVAASEAKLTEATETGSDSDGYIQVAEPAVESMAQLAQHDLDAMVDMAVAEHEEQMEASEASKARTEQKVVQEPQEAQEAQQSQKPIKSAAMSQAQLDEQLDQVTREVEAMGNPTLTMKTIQSKADKSATQPSKPSKAELKAAKKSAAKAAKQANAQLQKQLDQAEHALHPVVRSASKAFGQGKMSLDQVAAEFSQAGLSPANDALQKELNELIDKEEQLQARQQAKEVQGSGLSGAQVAALTRELAEHRAGYQDMMAQHKEIIQQHQDFSQAMHSKATESNLRLQSTVEAVRSFFSNALVNSGHAPLKKHKIKAPKTSDRLFFVQDTASDNVYSLIETDGTANEKVIAGGKLDAMQERARDMIRTDDTITFKPSDNTLAKDDYFKNDVIKSGDQKAANRKERLKRNQQKRKDAESKTEKPKNKKDDTRKEGGAAAPERKED